MDDSSTFWRSATAAFVGAFVGVALLAAILYAFPPFRECGRHEALVDRIPPLVSCAFTILVTILVARASKGSVTWSLVLVAPIYFLTFQAVIIGGPVNPSGCLEWRVPLFP